MQEKHSRDREMKVDCSEKKMFLSKRIVKRIFLLIFLLFIVFVHKGYSEDNAVKTEAGQAEAVQPSPQNVSLEILEAVKKEKIDLAKKEEKMKEEEKRLNELKETIDLKMKEYQALRTELESLVKRLEQFDEDNFKNLVKVYESMRPEEAGPLMSSLKEETAIKIFSQMNNKKAAKILPFVEPKKATRISEALMKKK